MWTPKDPPPPPPTPKFAIPSLSRAEIDRRAKRIKPVIRRGKKLHYIAATDPVTGVFTWDPKLMEEAIGLRRLCSIRTLHKFSYYGMFKPSIGEVLAQIPADILDKVVAFEITKSPETADDLNREKEAVHAGFHVAETALYTLDAGLVKKDALKPKTPLAKALLGDDDPFDD